MKLDKKVSAHKGLGTLPDSLKEIWFEIGASCHLNCEYCFAESGGIDDDDDNFNFQEIKSFLDDFVDMGGERIGIPGAGEPFHKKNRGLLFDILDYASCNDLHTLVFTTGDLLSSPVIDKLDNYANLTLMVKYNSSIEEKQNKLANVDFNYARKRDEALKRLIKRGQNDGERLGIVTSIMKDNHDEIPKIFRFARDNNIMFDADTIIPRGKGSRCGLDPISLKTKEVISKLQEIDRKEYGNYWEAHATYIASPPCTRFNQHLYVSKKGKVHPCVSTTAVELGDLKKESLNDIWEKKITKIIRGQNYDGKCTSCETYKKGECYSCLGRWTENLTTKSLLEDKVVHTTGCFNYK